MRMWRFGAWLGAAAALALAAGAFAQDVDTETAADVDAAPAAEDACPVAPVACPTPTTPAAAPFDPDAVPELTARDVTAWLDGYMPHALQVGDVVGAVVTVVKDGEVIASRGYGYADLETRTPVDPEHTLFRPGSISKLFTWTGVMQLVEQGELDLDADVSEYIDFDIPTPRGPITLRNLMTHTPGFEEVLRDLIYEGDTSPDLRDYLVTHVPEQIFTPGEMPSYSNYGTGLAGYIIERVSGETYTDYMENHILAPLGMTQSTFVQPLPERFEAGMSSGYNTRSEGEAQPFEIVSAMPAGSLSSTATDMAKFMIAHLHDGAGLMRPETAREMHDTILELFPPLNAMALGFFRLDRNGHPIIGHGGDTSYFHSDLFLVLDEDVGVYMSINSGGSGLTSWYLRQMLFENFMDRYFPGPAAPLPERLDTAAEHGRALAGAYESTRRMESSAFAAVSLMGGSNLTVNEDGDLVDSSFPGVDGKPRVFREVEPWVWRHVDGQDRLTARIIDGRVDAIAVEPLAKVIEATPAPGWRAPGLLLPLLAAAVTALLLTALSWPARAIIRTRYATPFPFTGGRALAHRAAPLASLLIVAFVFAWAGFFMWALSGGAEFGDDVAGVLVLLYGAAVVPFIAAAALVWVNVTVWRENASWFARAWAAVLALCALVVLWIAAVEKLFSFNLTF